jgi:DNA adenine methylase
MSKYSCEKCAKGFSQKSHYDQHISRKTPCNVTNDRIKMLIDKAVEEKIIEINKKLIVPNIENRIIKDTTMETQNDTNELKNVFIPRPTLVIRDKVITVSNGNIVKEFMHLKPLVKWSGGKSDEIKKFEKHFPSTYDTYLEPFVGGGSVYFYLSPKKAVISDVHSELIDFYISMGQRKAKEIYDFMVDHPNDEETYYKIREKMEINSKLDNAKRFYYQRKTCFRGMLRYNKFGKSNIPFGRYKTINYNDLQNKDYEELLSRTEILNKGFEHIFENYNNENNFMFLDPPYDSEFTDYGYCQFGKEEQRKLAKCFKETKIKCLMIIGKTSFIEELYDGYIVEEYEKKYKFKLYAGRVGDEINTKHLVIKNY